MKIYITDLEAYNSGHLIGEWLELPLRPHELYAETRSILNKGKRTCKSSHHHEEIFITDYECDYKQIEEYDDVFKLNKLAEQMAELEEHEQTAVKLMLENYIVNNIVEAVEHLEDMICTNETSMEDIAYQYVEDTGAIKSIGTLQAYFDFEALGRDMDMNGSYYEADNGIIWEYVA